MRLNRINAYLIVFVFQILISCTGTTKISDDQLLIRMEKTPCYGACPVYTLTIDQKGNGLFEGVENTEHIGLYSFRLSKKQVQMLNESFARAGFFEMDDSYHEHVMDLPTVYLTYHSNGRTKKIMDYYGAPKELKDLEDQVEALVLPMKMKKIR
jgi:hypothetical protein